MCIRDRCIPYVRGLSEKIDKVCKSLNRVTVKTVFKPIRTLRQALVEVKNKIPAEIKKGVIYEILCKDCSKVYMGETGRTLKKRMQEHKYAVRRFNRRNGIAVHVEQEDHRIDWDNARILAFLH